MWSAPFSASTRGEVSVGAEVVSVGELSSPSSTSVVVVTITTGGADGSPDGAAVGGELMNEVDDAESKEAELA